nr:hypothetical protein Iba_chr15bCG9530 [Ipomoea batatas]
MVIRQFSWQQYFGFFGRHGMLKCNIDAAILDNDAGFGAVVRDHLAVLLLCLAELLLPPELIAGNRGGEEGEVTGLEFTGRTEVRTPLRQSAIFAVAALPRRCCRRGKEAAALFSPLYRR